MLNANICTTIPKENYRLSAREKLKITHQRQQKYILNGRKEIVGSYLMGRNDRSYI